MSDTCWICNPSLMRGCIVDGRDLCELHREKRRRRIEIFALCTHPVGADCEHHQMMVALED